MAKFPWPKKIHKPRRKSEVVASKKIWIPYVAIMGGRGGWGVRVAWPGKTAKGDMGGQQVFYHKSTAVASGKKLLQEALERWPTVSFIEKTGKKWKHTIYSASDATKLSADATMLTPIFTAFRGMIRATPQGDLVLTRGKKIVSWPKGLDIKALQKAWDDGGKTYLAIALTDASY